MVNQDFRKYYIPGNIESCLKGIEMCNLCLESIQPEQDQFEAPPKFDMRQFILDCGKNPDECFISNGTWWMWNDRLDYPANLGPLNDKEIKIYYGL